MEWWHWLLVAAGWYLPAGWVIRAFLITDDPSPPEFPFVSREYPPLVAFLWLISPVVVLHAAVVGFLWLAGRVLCGRSPK